MTTLNTIGRMLKGNQDASESVLNYFERTKQTHFIDFQFKAQVSYLYDKSKTIHYQDYTMLVGMLKDYFYNKLNIDCGLTNDEIKDAIDCL